MTQVKYIIKFFLLSFWAFSVATPALVYAADPTIKIMTFNVNSKQPADGAEYRMNALADFIIKNKIEVVLLQEMMNWAHHEKNSQLSDDGAILEKLLKDKKYPMARYHKPYTGINGVEEFGNDIFSRYEAVPNSYEEFSLLDSKRWVPSIKLNTPIGQVRVLTIHTRTGSYTKPSVDAITQIVVSHYKNDPWLIVGGDWNIDGKDAKWNEMLSTVYVDLCGNRWGCQVVDRILAPKTTIFQVNESGGYVIPTYEAPISDHAATWISLGVKPGTQLPNPPPQPIGGNSSGKQGDVDGDGDVDVFDYNQVLSDFGKVGTSGFVQSDMKADGVVDIFDYNIVVSNFGK